MIRAFTNQSLPHGRTRRLYALAACVMALLLLWPASVLDEAAFESRLHRTSSAERQSLFHLPSATLFFLALVCCLIAIRLGTTISHRTYLILMAILMMPFLIITGIQIALGKR